MTSEQNCRLMPSAAASVASRIDRFVAEVLDERGAHVHGARTRGAAGVAVLLDPALVDRGCFRPAVGAVEEHHLAAVAVGLEEGLQVLLGAARLGEDQRLARRARRGHLLEADVQRREQGLGLGVGADAARPGGEPLQDVDLLAQLLPVDGARRALGLGFVRLREDLVEQVVLDLLRLDEPLGELRVVLHLLVAQRFETRTQRVQRGSDGLRRRRQQLAQDERGQVALALRERVAVLALQERRTPPRRARARRRSA